MLIDQINKYTQQFEVLFNMGWWGEVKRERWKLRVFY